LLLKTLPEAIEIGEDLGMKLAGRLFDTGKDRITLTWNVGGGEGGPGDTVDQILARADAPCTTPSSAAAIGWSGRMPGFSCGRQSPPSASPALLRFKMRPTCYFVLALFFCSVSRGMISMNEQGRWRLSSWCLRILRQASSQAPGEPGRQKI
jgi:hypothetical protein